MRSVLTLVAPDGTLDDGVLARLRAAVLATGAMLGDIDWLAPRSACDLPFDGPGIAEAESAARAALGGVAVDVVALDAAARRKRLLVADLESTIIDNEMLNEMAEIAGLGPQIAAATAEAMAGRIDFAASLRRRVKAFAGVDAGILALAAARVRLMPGAKSLIGTLRRHGVHTMLLSGGFTCFAEPVARALGFDGVEANELGLERGVLTGNVGEPILDRAGKAAALRRALAEQRLTAADAMAVGDGANDLDMLAAAGLGVAFHAKPIVAAAASARIDHADLRALLYLQGFRAEEIVAE